MAAPYDVSAYLLDKENVRDTVLRMVRDSRSGRSWPWKLKYGTRCLAMMSEQRRL